MDKSPAPSDRCNLLALRQAARQATQFYEGYFASIGLRATQFAILQRLGGGQKISINEMAQAMVMDATTMGRALRPLERDGYVVIGPGRDGRTRGLVLTPEGSEKLAAARAKWREATAAFEERFGAAPSAEMRSMMRSLVAALGGP